MGLLKLSLALKRPEGSHIAVGGIYQCTHG